MLKRLRVKIVAIVMAISFVVLALAFGAVMSATWSSASEPLAREMELALERGTGKEAVIMLGGHGPERGAEASSSGSAPDASFMPVAVVSVGRDGTVVSHNDMYLLMDEEVRVLAVAGACSSSSDTGLLSEAGVMFCRQEADDGLLIAFVDAGAFTAVVRNAARGTAAVFAGALAALLVVSVLLSRLITKPVQQAWDRQGEFVADASHELKTPLTVILANADILRDHPDELTADQAKWVSSIASEAKRMKGLVEEMLFLARSDAAPQGSPAELPEVDLAEVCRQSALSFDAVAFEAGVDLSADIADAAPVKGDRAKLERLVNILVDNAIKYAGRGGRARIRLVSRKRGHATLSVTNSGDPIPPDELGRVFDRFWRSDRTRSSSGSQGASFGLGLSIAKSIAEEHGGKISVASDAASGTTFTVAL